MLIIIINLLISPGVKGSKHFKNYFLSRETCFFAPIGVRAKFGEDDKPCTLTWHGWIKRAKVNVRFL